MKLGLHPRRFFPSSNVGQRWLEQGVARVLRQQLVVPAEVPPAPESDEDVMAPLRRVTCGGGS